MVSGDIHPLGGAKGFLSPGPRCCTKDLTALLALDPLSSGGYPQSGDDPCVRPCWGGTGGQWWQGFADVTVFRGPPHECPRCPLVACSASLGTEVTCPHLTALTTPRLQALLQGEAVGGRAGSVQEAGTGEPMLSAELSIRLRVPHSENEALPTCTPT